MQMFLRRVDVVCVGVVVVSSAEVRSWLASEIALTISSALRGRDNGRSMATKTVAKVS